MPTKANVAEPTSEKVNSVSDLRLPCFKHGCSYRGKSMSLVLRHAKSHHHLNYCRECCDFYEPKSAYCPGCQRFCMSPSCLQGPSIVIAKTGDVLSQRHKRGPRCPKVWGSSSGVSDEQVLEYLRRLDSFHEGQTNDHPAKHPEVTKNSVPRDPQHRSVESMDLVPNKPSPQERQDTPVPTSATASYPMYVPDEPTSGADYFASTAHTSEQLIASSDRSSFLAQTEWNALYGAAVLEDSANPLVEINVPNDFIFGPSENDISQSHGITWDVPRFNDPNLLDDDPTKWVWDGVYR